MYISNRQNVNYAITYAKQSLFVYPVWGIDPQSLKCNCNGSIPNCRAGKHPCGKIVKHGNKDATIDPLLIVKWFVDETINIGIDCKQSELLVIDFDLKHGGMDSHMSWETEYGAMPLTPCVSTGGGGRHYYFKRHPAITKNMETLKKYGVDVLVNGGLIAPPSLHTSGNRYEWLTPCDTPLADCPAWLVSLITLEQDDEPQDEEQPFDPMTGFVEQTGTTFDAAGTCPAGKRNGVVNRIVGSMLASGYSAEQIMAQGTAWADKQSPPYSLTDLRSKVKDFVMKEKAKGSYTGVRVIEDNSEFFAGMTIIPCFGEWANGEQQNGNSPIRYSPSNNPTYTPLPVGQTNDDALYGLVGDTIRAITPQTEIDEAGILFALLTAFGSVIGHKPYCNIGARRHYCNLFVVLHAPTGVGKGEAWHIVKSLFSSQENWLADCLDGHFGSGEGLVERVMDEQTIIEGGKEVIQAGVADKRLMVVDAEFRNTLILCRRPDSTLSGHILKAWDGEQLSVMNRKKNSLRSTDHHISIIGNITTKELSEALSKGSEAFNGFGNRFLWIAIRRSKIITFPKPIDFGDLRERWAKAIAIAQQIERMSYDKSFESAYEEICPALVADQSDETLKVNVLERSRPYVFRLSMLYALADGKAVMTAEHCKAAYSAWRINVEGCKAVFGSVAGDKPTSSLTERLLSLIRASSKQGMSRTDMHNAFSRKITKDDLDFAISQLEQNDLISSRRITNVVRWFAGTDDRPTGGVVGKFEDDEADCKKVTDILANTAKSEEHQLANSSVRQFAVDYEQTTELPVVEVVKDQPSPVGQPDDSDDWLPPYVGSREE